MRFTKMQGIGNDYVYVNCFEEHVENPSELAKQMSRRHYGVGSDGLILICPSDVADFEMKMYNADGSNGGMCGNGARCIGKYVYDRGLTDKTTGRVMPQQLYFTDNGEVGSAHISVNPKRNATYTSLGSAATVTMTESNELRGVYKIDIAMDLPAEATIDGNDRSRGFKTLAISTTLTLNKGEKFLRIRTTLDNRIRDHKLVVNFPSGLTAAEWVDCESAWDVAHRTINHLDTKDNFDKFLPFQPMQNFVDVSDGKDGLAVMTKGLREYEVDDDKLRTIKITLIRTQRAYMTANSKMTYEELDRYTGQHSFGKMTYEMCLYPHQGNFEAAHVWNAAYAAKVPLKAIQGVATNGVLPDCASFVTFSQEGKVMTSALKQAENGDGLTLRVQHHRRNVAADDIHNSAGQGSSARTP